MNKSKKLLQLIEAVLKMPKVDYKSDPHGNIAYGNINIPSYYNSFKSNHQKNQEIHNTLHVHDELSKEAHDQFGKDEDGKKKDAVSEYTGISYTSMNGHLRHGNSIDDSDKLRIGHLKTLTKNKTKHSFTTYRTTSSKVTDTAPGSMFQDHGFTSTTLRPSFGADNFDGGSSTAQHFKIHVKKGTKGHYVSAHTFSNGEGHEKEFLLHPGTKFKVGKTTKHANGKTYINLHVHSQEADSHPDDFNIPKHIDIDKESPDENHKFILNHHKNHLHYGKDEMNHLHKSLIDKTSEEKEATVAKIKKNYPSKYGPKVDIEKDSPNEDHKFVLNHMKNHLGYTPEQLTNVHNDFKKYPSDVEYEKKKILKNNPHLYPHKQPEPFDIDKHSPNDEHKFVLNHYKNHAKYDDESLKSLHGSLSTYPEDTKTEFDYIKKQHPHLYPEKKIHSYNKEIDTHGIEEYHSLDRNHKSILDNAKHNHGYDNESVKDLHNIVGKVKGQSTTFQKQKYAKLLANAKSKSEPFDNLV